MRLICRFFFSMRSQRFLPAQRADGWPLAHASVTATTNSKCALGRWTQPLRVSRSGGQITNCRPADPVEVQLGFHALRDSDPHLKRARRRFFGARFCCSAGSGRLRFFGRFRRMFVSYWALPIKPHSSLSCGFFFSLDWPSPEMHKYRVHNGGRAVFRCATAELPLPECRS